MALLAPLAVAAFGQSPTATTAAVSAAAGPLRSALPPPPVTGSPYSAEEIGESVRTLSDGTEVTRPAPKSKVYRDSAGRIRTERSLPVPAGREQATGAKGRVLISITDPVAQVRYTLNETDKTAHKQNFRTAEIRPASTAHATAADADTRSPVAPAAPDAQRPTITVEDLGNQTIEGMLVKGTRRTTTWPAGSRHNEQPIAVVAENWISPDLHITVLSKVNDPAMGNLTRKWINISRAEPDPKLFRLPADYTIVDDAAAARAARMRAASLQTPPVAADVASAPPPPQPARAPEPVAQPEPAGQPEPAPSDATPVDDSAAESSFADAPPADAPADPSAYVGVNAVYVGVIQVNPPAPKAPAVAKPSKPVAAPVRPKPKPKIPAPEKPAQ
jgi:hypothetical protein